MNKFDYKNLTPFKWFVLENFPFIEADFDALTEWELFCKLGKEMNKIINSENTLGTQMENVTNAFIELQNYVNNFFTDLNIQDEINNKLNDMAEDGTLAKIINENIFNELNNKVDTLQEEYEKTKLKNNIYLGAFFNGDTEKLNFCVSNDGLNFSDILPNVDISGRDPNIIYNPKNKTFYLSVTDSGNTWDFTCYTSKDLINWTRHYVSLGILTGIRWAPELFFDKNGDLWATITEGTDIYSNMTLYKSKCNNEELLTFDVRTPINVSQQNIIDSNIIYDKDNDIYYLTCKNNTTSLQLIYSSSDLENWDLVNSNVLKTGEPCEGGFMIKTNKKFTFYGDTWQSFNYFIIAQSENPANFNNFTRPNSLINKRHGSICFIENQEVVALITNLESYKQMENINQITSQEFLINGNIDTLIVYPNFIYRVSETSTINKLINAYDLLVMPFYFATYKNATLTIKNVVNSEFQTKTINKTIYNSTYSNEKLNFITLIGNPVLNSNSDFISYNISENITISEGWTVAIYAIRRFKDFVHIDGDITKTSSATSNVAFNINSNLRPYTHTFTTTSMSKSGWLKTDGNFELLNAEINQRNFISFDYLCF